MAVLDAASAKRLANAHPLLQKLFKAVAAKTPIVVLDSQRGRAAQELAFKRGNSKVHFGQSAHNWTPAIALDVCPLPLNWKNTKPFIVLGRDVVMPLAKQMGIPIRWGADFDQDGVLLNNSFIDLPHYELTPWRTFAKAAKPFEG